MPTLQIKSRKPVEMIDITGPVTDCIRDSGVTDGLAVIFVPHTTAAVTINENADPDVALDLSRALPRLVPGDIEFRHAEGNSPAHLLSTLVGASEMLVVERGRPVLGTWQGIYFCEFDGPRQRGVRVQVLGA